MTRKRALTKLLPSSQLEIGIEAKFLADKYNIQPEEAQRLVILVGGTRADLEAAVYELQAGLA
ncbi:hypothetical protein FHS85_005177 [Rhodoligotrophos appendicifer]|uniref:hypothetical protein n=1 Tax=Rhodoligotrophos appendicifer TaxID=987056 RepID=UPI0011850665|nr:hypothetical protein [Rhodoligotrophos appendicifer]